jgi:N-acetylmuramoyl-L-alanine amidase
MTRYVISSGHGLHVRGASGYIDEVDEARRVTETVADFLRGAGHDVKTFHDNTSTSQDENLYTIVAYHNSQSRDVDVSVHFNAYSTTSKPMGCEVWYYSQANLASMISDKMAMAMDLPDRGAKYSGSLYFLSNTEMPSVLLEVCFVDSSTDAAHYNGNYDACCEGIAEGLSGQEISDIPPEPEPIPPDPEEPESGDNRVDITSAYEGDVSVYVNGSLVHGHEGCEHVARVTLAAKGDVVITVNGQLFHQPPPESPTEPADALLHVQGKCSWFGGPEDMGVAADEGLAFIFDYDTAPYLFLDQQPPGTTGLARRLDTEHVYYVACRWDYDVTPKTMLAQDIKALVRANGKEFMAWPADWGPHEDTGRVADISHALMHALGVETDDEIEVIYPAEEYVA